MDFVPFVMTNGTHSHPRSGNHRLVLDRIIRRGGTGAQWSKLYCRMFNLAMLTPDCSDV